jgi:hypothetical protein
MKISVNDTELYTLTQTQLDVLANDIHIDELEADLKRRLNWVINHKYEQCHERLVKEWMPKLVSKGVASVPTDKEAFARLVFSQPDYKDRATRDAEALAAKQGE